MSAFKEYGDEPVFPYVDDHIHCFSLKPFICQHRRQFEIITNTFSLNATGKDRFESYPRLSHCIKYMAHKIVNNANCDVLYSSVYSVS